MKRVYIFIYSFFLLVILFCLNLYGGKPQIFITLTHHPQPTSTSMGELPSFLDPNLSCCPSYENWCGFDGEEAKNAAKTKAVDFINNNKPRLQDVLYDLLGAEATILDQADNLTLTEENWVFVSENYKKYELNYTYNRYSVSRFEDEDAIYIIKLTETYDFNFLFDLKRGDLCNEDYDGVVNIIENDCPDANGINFGDGNGDGIPDAKQGYVTSFRDFRNKNYITISTDSSHHFNNVISQEPETLTNIIFPYGIFSFTVDNVSDRIEIKIFIPKDERITGYWKKNLKTGQWENIAKKIEHGPNYAPNKTVITLSLMDNDDYDSNSNDGIITDPGGPGLPATAAPATPVPTMTEWGMIIFMMLLGTIAVWQMKNRTNI